MKKIFKFVMTVVVFYVYHFLFQYLFLLVKVAKLILLMK